MVARINQSPLLLALLAWAGALLVLAPAALAFNDPGFMDAYYYYHVAVSLATGRGFVEDVIWNYLADPVGVPQPSNLYWMPLVPIVAAPFISVLGESFRAAQAPFVLLSAAVPAVTAVVGRRVLGGLWPGVAAGALVLFGGYYFVYWVAIDAFALFGLAGMAVFLATAALASAKSVRRHELLLAVGLGLATAAAHLARADGPLLLASAIVTLGVVGRPGTLIVRIRLGSIAVAAYVACILPWLVRNVAVAGTPLPGGGARTLFLREYNEIFSYGLSIGPEWYFSQGFGPLLEAKLLAALRNLGVLFGLEYWLVPFAVVGWLALRRDRRFVAALVYGVILYLVMTLLFTFPSGRGSMLHSSVALLPWLAIAAVRGIAVAVDWIASRLRHWNVPLATRNFTLIFVLCSAAVSVYLAIEQAAGWGSQVEVYRDLSDTVYAAGPTALPMLLNPPGWWYATRRPAIEAPSNGPTAALAAADRYGATHLIIEPARARDWGPFLDADAWPGFRLIWEEGGYQVYELGPASGRK